MNKNLGRAQVGDLSFTEVEVDGRGKAASSFLLSSRPAALQKKLQAGAGQYGGDSGVGISFSFGNFRREAIEIVFA